MSKEKRLKNKAQKHEKFLRNKEKFVNKIISEVKANESKILRPFKYSLEFIDTEDSWSWKDGERQMTQEEKNYVLTKLDGFSQQDWGQVSCGDNDINHYDEGIAKFCNEAKLRWNQRGLGDFSDSVYRLYMGGNKIRVYGFVVEEIFYMVWYDRKHLIYPTPLKNT